MSKADHPMIPEIDGFRGLAICAVIFHHQFSVPLAALHPALFGIDLKFIYASGWLGVNLFFILSGMVLYLPYSVKRRHFTSWADVVSFYKHRALRLLPAYYLITIAESVFSGRQPFDTSAHTAETITLLTLTFPFSASTFSPSTNWALWSVGAEFIFSAIFPLLAVLASRYGAIKLLLCYLPIGLIIRAIAHYSSPHPIVWLSDGLAIGRFDEFIWGMVLAELLASSRIPKRPLAMLFLSVLVILPTLAGINASVSGHIPHYCMAFLTTSFDLGIALAIGAAICRRSLFSRGLTVKPLRIMGMACYSIYLWHMPLLSQLRLHIDPWNVPVLFGAIIYLTILSAITYRYVEFRRVEDWRSLFLISPMITKSRPSIAGDREQPSAGASP